MNERQMNILRAIARQPVTARSFTHAPNGPADCSCSPAVIQSYLDHLTNGGLIEEPDREGGAYTITDEGRAYLAAIPDAAPPVQFGNYSMPPGSLVLPAWPHAAERGERNKLIRSRGLGT